VAGIRWTRQALSDLEAIGDFIARDAPGIAQVFVDRIFDAVQRLERFPRSGRIVPEVGREDLREVLFGNYRIVYMLSDEEVSVLLVFHASRLFRASDLPEDARE
jgi:toxin ParE1/3/4